MGLQVARERRLTVGAKLLRLLPLKLSEGGLVDPGVLGEIFQIASRLLWLLPPDPISTCQVFQRESASSLWKGGKVVTCANVNAKVCTRFTEVLNIVPMAHVLLDSNEH